MKKTPFGQNILHNSSTSSSGYSYPVSLRARAEYLLQEALKIGLNRDQVSTKNFGHHTIHAIKDELAKEDPLSLEAAFAKYSGLDNIQVDGIELGRSREKVSTKNFGGTTIDAIKAELAKEDPLSLEAAFAKYSGLNWLQVKAMSELDLSRKQVSTKNFGHHTIDAIKDELAKEDPLSLEAAFAKYRGLDSIQVQGVSELGMSRDRVSADDFGEHTISAITAVWVKLSVAALDKAFAQHYSRQKLSEEVESVGVSDDEECVL